jgi:hypothetical protein
MEVATQTRSWVKQHDGLLGMAGKNDDTFTFDIPEGYQFAGFNATVLAGQYRPGVRVKKLPGHGTTGKGKQAEVYWWFGGGSQPFIKYKATATFIDGIVEKDQRALLVVSDLVDEGLSQFKELYKLLESLGPWTVLGFLENDYKHVASLTGADATSTKFMSSLADLAGSAGIGAVDAVLMLHGRREGIHFRDRVLTGGVGGSIRQRLGAMNLGAELRACFSTCCWGETVADDLVAAGFRVACGAKDVYANGAYGIPAALLNWKNGETFSRAVSKANNQIVLAATDAIISHIHPMFATANSYWTISGKKSTRITSEAS